MHYIRFTVALVSLMAAAGCGSPASTTTTSCDVNQLFTVKYACSASGCHDAVGTAANFDMATGGLTGLEGRLVGHGPVGGGVLPSMCAGMGFNYLDAGSQPATGLFMSKFSDSPPCGTRMPMLGNKVNAADLSCIQTWANGLTKP
jgi:hypothetical protein